MGRWHVLHGCMPFFYNAAVDATARCAVPCFYAKVCLREVQNACTYLYSKSACHLCRLD